MKAIKKQSEEAKEQKKRLFEDVDAMERELKSESKSLQTILDQIANSRKTKEDSDAQFSEKS